MKKSTEPIEALDACLKRVDQLAPSYRRYFVAWIHTAKRPATREKHIRESIRLLAARKKLGLK